MYIQATSISVKLIILIILLSQKKTKHILNIVIIEMCSIFPSNSYNNYDDKNSNIDNNNNILKISQY